MATFTTPEVRAVFEEWARIIEDEIVMLQSVNPRVISSILFSNLLYDFVMLKRHLKRMSFKTIAERLNALILQRCPEVINSSWIFKNSPDCYRFIRRNIRTE